MMVVSADNSAALEGLLRPLPHYRRYGYVVFDGPRAGLRGVWPSTDSALDHRFDEAFIKLGFLASGQARTDEARSASGKVGLLWRGQQRCHYVCSG